VDCYSILVVDDSSGSRVLFRTLREKAGCQVKCAQKASDALAILAEFNPDLILIDFLLPGMSGLELARQLKSIPAMRETVIVAVTTCTLASDLERALAVGCAGVIGKPINPGTFVALVRSYLGHLKPALPIQ
jgi:CheY-like chemotaxis protein